MADRFPSERPGPARARITDRDRELLAFAAEHRLVRAEHIQALVGISYRAAHTRLRALTQAGFLRRRAVFERGPGWQQITRRGLAVIDSSLPPPREDLRAYDHDVGVAWLWLAAQDGAFGPLAEVLGERRLRAHDGARDPQAEPLGVRLGGIAARGGERLHYPDLLLRRCDGRRLALELELSPKTRTRLETILAGYGADRRIDAVVYLVESRAVARKIQSAARKLGVSGLVYIQPMIRARAGPTGPRAHAAERTRHGAASPRAYAAERTRHGAASPTAPAAGM